MREVLDILNEARHYNGMPEKIRVQNPADFTKHSVVWTRPEITWEHRFPVTFNINHPVLKGIDWKKLGCGGYFVSEVSSTYESIR